jgi:hypothetical protein
LALVQTADELAGLELPDTSLVESDSTLRRFLSDPRLTALAGQLEAADDLRTSGDPFEWRPDDRELEGLVGRLLSTLAPWDWP